MGRCDGGEPYGGHFFNPCIVTKTLTIKVLAVYPYTAGTAFAFAMIDLYP